MKIIWPALVASFFKSEIKFEKNDVVYLKGTSKLVDF